MQIQITYYGAFTNYVDKTLPVIDHLVGGPVDICEGISFTEIKENLR